jgi:hypothetical protein
LFSGLFPKNRKGLNPIVGIEPIGTAGRVGLLSAKKVRDTLNRLTPFCANPGVRTIPQKRHFGVGVENGWTDSIDVEGEALPLYLHLSTPTIKKGKGGGFNAVWMSLV